MAAVSDEPAPETPQPANPQAAAHIQQMVKYHHKLEVETYKIITRDNNPKLQTTKIYASRDFSESSPVGFLVCEFVPDTRSITNYDVIPYERVVPVIDTAAAFSAMGERMSEEEKKGTVGVKFLEQRTRSFVPESVSFQKEVCRVILLFQTIPKVRKTLSEAVGEDFPTEKMDKLMSFITLFASNSTGVAENYSRIFEFLGHSPVLNHSDLWGGNMLFTKDSEGQLEFKALIDFQAPSLSSPGLDVAAISVTCLSSEVSSIEHTSSITSSSFRTGRFIRKLSSRDTTKRSRQISENLQFPTPSSSSMTPLNCASHWSPSSSCRSSGSWQSMKREKKWVSGFRIQQIFWIPGPRAR